MTDARTDRITAIAHDLADLLKDAMDRVVELSDLDVPPADVMEILKHNKLELADGVAAKLAAFGYSMMGVTPQTPTGKEAIRAQIEELFREAPAPIAGTSPAIADVAIVLRGFPHPIAGVVTKCPSGMLKIGAVDPSSSPGQPRALLEHFFTYEDVVAIVVRREMKAAPGSTIITSH